MKERIPNTDTIQSSFGQFMATIRKDVRGALEQLPIETQEKILGVKLRAKDNEHYDTDAYTASMEAHILSVARNILGLPETAKLSEIMAAFYEREQKMKEND